MGLMSPLDACSSGSSLTVLGVSGRDSQCGLSQVGILVLLLITSSAVTWHSYLCRLLRVGIWRPRPIISAIAADLSPALFGPSWTDQHWPGLRWRARSLVRGYVYDLLGLLQTRIYASLRRPVRLIACFWVATAGWSSTPPNWRGNCSCEHLALPALLFLSIWRAQADADVTGGDDILGHVSW